MTESTETRTPAHPNLDQLITTVSVLRAPGGCPWDAEQTHESLVRYLIEESHELVDAIESGSRAEMVEELGDVLYQVLFHSEIAANAADPAERFTIDDVAEHMNHKMVGRHPHVFADGAAETSDDVVAAWDELKKIEKPERTSVLDGIPQGMPALALADKVLGKAEKAGLIEAGEQGALSVSSEDELGPLLLAIVASARANGLDAERALRTTLRGLQAEIRDAEQGDVADAGVIGRMD